MLARACGYKFKKMFSQKEKKNSFLAMEYFCNIFNYLTNLTEADFRVSKPFRIIIFRSKSSIKRIFGVVNKRR